MTKSMYRILGIADCDEWNRVLPPNQSVFGSHAFMSIAATHNKYEPQLLVVEDCDGMIAYPYFLRPTGTMAFANGIAVFDSMTPEFTGPLVTGSASLDLRHSFRTAIETEWQKNSTIAEFAHLHPWGEQDGLLDPALIAYDRDIVWIDVSLSHDVLWKEHFSHACRKNIKRSQRENVRVFEAETEEHFREFFRIYVHQWTGTVRSPRTTLSSITFCRFASGFAITPGLCSRNTAVRSLPAFFICTMPTMSIRTSGERMMGRRKFARVTPWCLTQSTGLRMPPQKKALRAGWRI